MGNVVERIRAMENRNNLGGDDDGADFGRFVGLRDPLLDDFQDEDDDDNAPENEFASILRHLIRSGEIMVLNYESYLQRPLPVIRNKPKLHKLKRNDIYHSTKSASGQQDDTGGRLPGVAGGTGAFSLMDMVIARQHGFGKGKGRFMQRDQCKLTNHFRPNIHAGTIYAGSSKVFCGKFTGDGDRFVTASQDTQIRVYDSSRGMYNRVRTLDTKHVSWSILDMDFSPDGRTFVYSTWADALFISSIDQDASDNIQCLYLSPFNLNKLGVFTVCYSNCGKHILCGANDGSLYVYDLEANRRSLMAPVARGDTDVNTVGFVDELSNIFFSGSDDCVIKLWDRRCMDESNPEEVGRLIGHIDGITHIDSRKDGRYIISNSKDQSIKLWDLRNMSNAKPRRDPLRINWDYRWDDVPSQYFHTNLKPIRGDTSVMTYRGHQVQRSLIRAKFSPAATTGQRYIYTGCAMGRLIIYDVLTGAVVEAIRSHDDLIRDVAWHPHRPEILTCSWDHNVNIHLYSNPVEQQENLERMFGVKSGGLDEDASDQEHDSTPANQPPARRRSRRLAERNSGAGSGSSNNTGRSSRRGVNSNINSNNNNSTRRRSNRTSAGSSNRRINSSRSRSTSNGRLGRNRSLTREWFPPLSTLGRTYRRT